jgi:hypothetical protein
MPARPWCLAQWPSSALKTTRNSMGDAIAAVEVKYLRSGKLAARMSSVAPFGSQQHGFQHAGLVLSGAGRYDLYLHGGQRLWDYAAGAVILEEAGGRLASLNTDDYWSDTVWKRSVIAAIDPELYCHWYRWVCQSVKGIVINRKTARQGRFHCRYHTHRSIVFRAEMPFHQLDQDVQHLDVQFLHAVGILAARGVDVDIGQGSSRVAARPVRMITFMPSSRATVAALTMVWLLPLVLMPISTSPARPWLSR